MKKFDEKFYRYCDSLLSLAEVSIPLRSQLILDFLEDEVTKVLAEDWESVTSEEYYEVQSRIFQLSNENEFMNEKLLELVA